MLPASTACRPAARSRRQARVAVVDLPLLPVMARTGSPAALIAAMNSSEVVVTAMPRAAAIASSGWVRRIPGERTRRSTSARAAVIASPVTTRRVSGTVAGGGSRSAKTSGGGAPRRARVSQVERPSAPAPKMPTRRSASVEIVGESIAPAGGEAVDGARGELAADLLLRVFEGGGDGVAEPAQRRQRGIGLAPAGEPQGGGDLARSADAIPRLVVAEAEQGAHHRQVLGRGQRAGAEDRRHALGVEPGREHDGGEDTLGAAAAPATGGAGALLAEVGVAGGHGAEPAGIGGEEAGDAQLAERPQQAEVDRHAAEVAALPGLEQLFEAQALAPLVVDLDAAGDEVAGEALRSLAATISPKPPATAT